MLRSLSAARRREARSIVAAAVLAFALPAASEPASKRSGFEDMGPASQAMQRDDDANPGMLWVQDGAGLWDAAPATGAPSCAGCHGAASASMRGVAARYPAWDDTQSKPIDLQGRIAQCRTRRQNAPAFGPESRELLALSAFVGSQSRGTPLAPPVDPRLDAPRARGEALFRRRIGQLDLSCATCHDERAGGRLGGALIPQGHPNGYPLYRLEWQELGSLQRRLRNCMTGVRAEPYDYGAAEFIELELYLAARAAPLPVEIPAVRP